MATQLETLPATSHRHKPVPPAFAEVFVRVGWRGVEAAYGSRTACNRRWIGECGDLALMAERRAYRRRLRALKQERHDNAR